MTVVVNGEDLESRKSPVRISRTDQFKIRDEMSKHIKKADDGLWDYALGFSDQLFADKYNVSVAGIRGIRYAAFGTIRKANGEGSRDGKERRYSTNELAKFLKEQSKLIEAQGEKIETLAAAVNNLTAAIK